MAGDDNKGSIYEAPSSDISVPLDGDRMAAFVGPNYREYYQKVFGRFDEGGSLSWNWPAFFATAFWLLYRKMWVYGLLYWFVFPVVLAFVAGIIAAAIAIDDPVSAFFWTNVVYYGIYVTVSFIIMPIIANRLYYRHANKKLAKISGQFPNEENQQLELARKGGTSGVAIIVVVVFLIALLGVLAAIAIPAYQDYTVRAQVSEGLYLSSEAKAAVSEYYLDQQNYPADNRDAGLPSADRINGTYISAVEVSYGNITVTYGNDAHQLLQDKTLLLIPDSSGARVEWSCSSESIMPRHLPAACR